MFVSEHLQKQFIEAFRSGSNMYCQMGVGTGKTYLCAKTLIESKRTSLVVVPTKEIALNFYQKVRACGGTATRLGSLAWVAPVVELMSDQQARQRTNYSSMMKAMATENAKKMMKKPEIISILPVSLLNLLAPEYKPEVIVMDEFDLLYNPHSSVDKLMNLYKGSQKVLMCGVQNEWKDNVCSKGEWAQIIKSGLNPLGTSITHKMKRCDSKEEKNIALIQILQNEMEKYIIFVNSVETAKDLHSYLNEQKIYSSVLHADLSTEKRIETYFKFISSPSPGVLISSHIGSRSLDYPGVSTVIQYDFPEDQTTFYQQAGRVARVGKPECKQGTKRE